MEMTSLPWFLQMNLGLTVPLPAETPTGMSQRFGPGVGATAVGGLEIVPDVFVLSSSVRSQWDTAIHMDGEEVENSERFSLSADVSVSWIFDPHWTLMASAETGVFVSGFGDNVPGLILGSIGLRYGFF